MIHLVNADIREWRAFRDAFDPEAATRQLALTAPAVYDFAQGLLANAHRIDPVGNSWSLLMRRAPQTAWKDLTDAALLSIDYRVAAELLLRVYEDLVDRGLAEPLAEVPRNAWHPLQERLSYRQDTLDQNLMDLGISPHPRVILAIEGETEATFVPLVWRALGYEEAPELMRTLNLGSVDRDLEKVAAVAVAPLVGGRMDNQAGWWLIKPPTKLVVAVDPEGKYFATEENRGKTRAKILREIRRVLRAQGAATPSAGELDSLIEIRVWSASCFEFEHFTDEELADGIMAIHHTLNGLSRTQLIESLANSRRRRKDIKEVWSLWDYQVSKTKLAVALWPVLETKVQLAQSDGPVPAIADVIQSAYMVAQSWRRHAFVLRDENPEPVH